MPTMTVDGLLTVLSLLLQYLVPAFIALVALAVVARIQRNHAETAKARLKLDLFEKRYEFLQTIRNITMISLANDGRYFDRVQKDYARFAQYKLLFPLAIQDLVDGIIRRCDELFISSENLRLLPPENPESEAEKKNQAELRRQIAADMAQLQRRIEDFIRIDWNG